MCRTVNLSIRLYILLLQPRVSEEERGEVVEMNEEAEEEGGVEGSDQ